MGSLSQSGCVRSGIKNASNEDRLFLVSDTNALLACMVNNEWFDDSSDLLLLTRTELRPTEKDSAVARYA